ncbi:MAG: hypothetical protein OQK82_07625 [Candidatus Pacearchaeota archaeon]|nr:hypothetical protein [Candidatus Pacearchaeota archaeon]
MKVKINISNRAIYSLIILTITIFLGIGVYAYNSGFNPSTMGHSLDEIGIPTNCLADQTLKWNGNKWSCSDETKLSESDPTVSDEIKDGISWSEINNIPSGFADKKDNQLSSSGTYSSMKVGTATKASYLSSGYNTVYRRYYVYYDRNGNGGNDCWAADCSPGANVANYIYTNGATLCGQWLASYLGWSYISSSTVGNANSCGDTSAAYAIVTVAKTVGSTAVRNF